MENHHKRFDVYIHPLLPQRIVKSGFSWPAFLIGPAWLLVKRLWMPAIFAAVGFLLLTFFNSEIETPVFASMFCVKVGLFSDSPSQFYPTECLELIRTANDFLILLIVNFVIAVYGNEVWARDLINRGYISGKSIQARSLDEALAIMARSRADLSQT